MKWLEEEEEYKGAADEVADLGPNLWAISAALRCLELQELATELMGEGGPFRREAVVRLAWIQYHQQLIQRGRRVGYPFEARVGPRSSHSRQRDREFYTLLLLARWLYQKEGREVLLQAASEGPDFLCFIDGENVGVEVTEAVREGRSSEEAYSDGLADRLSELARELGVSLDFQSESGVHHFVPALESMERKIRSVFAAGASDSFEEAVGGHSCQIGVELGRPPMVLYSDPRGYGSDELRLNEAELVDCVHGSIMRKLERSRPSVRPCILAIYPNALDEVDLPPSLELAKESLVADCRPHFDEVWVVHDEACLRLI